MPSPLRWLRAISSARYPADGAYDHGSDEAVGGDTITDIVPKAVVVDADHRILGMVQTTSAHRQRVVGVLPSARTLSRANADEVRAK